MRKIISIFLVVVILVSTIMLSGCNINVDTTNSKTTQPTNPTNSTTSTEKVENPPIDDVPEIYSITYECAPGKNSINNPLSYEQGEEFLLEPATLDGYTFLEWVDEDGNPVSSITPKMSKDITLYATWRANRNVSHPISEIINPVYDPYMFFVEGDEYVFIYYLGYIDRVPLDTVGIPFEHDPNTVGSTKEFESSTANSNSIQQSTSKVTENTDSWQVGAEFGAQINIGPVASVSFKLSGQISGSTTNIVEDGEITIVSSEAISSQKTTMSFTSEHPFGYYRYTNFALVDVFAVITYDPVTKEYGVSNVNSVRNIWQGLDYSAFSNGFDDNENIELPFEFPNDIEETVNAMAHAYTPGLQWLETTDDNGHPVAYVVGYDGNDTDIIIPSFYCNAEGKSFTVLGIKNITGSVSGGVFANSSINSIKLGKHVELIDSYSFYNCSELKLTLPEHISKIGNFAFAGCTSLIEMNISSNVVSLGEKAFYDCPNLTINVQSINSNVFENAAKSGAGIIKIFIADNAKIQNIDDAKVYDVTKYFEINGNSKALNNVYITSNALETYISDISLNNGKGGIGLTLSSKNVTLYNVEITMNGLSGNAVKFTNENASLVVCGIVTLTAGEGEVIAGTAIVANNLDISSLKHDTIGELVVNGGIGYPKGTGGNGISAKNIKFEGYLKISVLGGKGFDVFEKSIGDGNSGGLGILANSITIELDSVSEFIVSGGKGGNAYHRSSGDNPGDGENGIDGFKGGNGAHGIQCKSIEVISGNLVVTGGDGGGGGDASECNLGGPWNKDVKGGTGGNGGDAGFGIVAEIITVHDNVNVNVSLTGGTGGYTGRRGGCNKDQHQGMFTEAKDGDKGTPGDGGLALSSTCEIIDPAKKIVATNGETGWVDDRLNQD